MVMIDEDNDDATRPKHKTQLLSTKMFFFTSYLIKTSSLITT